MTPDEAIAAGRRIAGLIGHSPGPGIYSRMQRAVEAMPEMVRAEELPGLIRRHKEGVPGWELKAVDLPSLYDGQTAVPREELLRAVQERSPLYTHGEYVQRDIEGDVSNIARFLADEPLPGPFDRRIGQGVPSGGTEFGKFSQGGDDYTEILLTQPGARHGVYGNHWGMSDAVAHARFDRHGDALRINELQSDLGIHNRKARESIRDTPDGSARLKLLDFPLEDAWLDLLIKRLALETARGGYRAIEIASPRSIADEVGGNIDNYEHLYGKVVPGALERLGRKMGGLVREGIADAPEPVPYLGSRLLRGAEADRTRAYNDLRLHVARAIGNHSWPADSAAFDIAGAVFYPDPISQASYARDRMVKLAIDGGLDESQAMSKVNEAMPGLMRLAEDWGEATRIREALSQADLERPVRTTTNTPGRRYLMSDEMRRNILRNGIPASVLGAAALSNERQP